jgi:hypothetical protein
MPLRAKRLGYLVASLSADTKDGSGGGSNTTSELEAVVGSNSITEVGGVYYVLAYVDSDDTQVFQFYKSADAGETWTTAGSSFTPSVSGGGMNLLLDGTKIYVTYSRGGFLGIYLTYFETASDTWSGSEDWFDYGPTLINADGPFQSFKRSDGSFVFLMENLVGSSGIWAAVWDAGWIGIFGPMDDGATDGNFETAIMDSADTVHVFFYASTTGDRFYHAQFDASNTVTEAGLEITYTGQILDWNGNGLGFGFLDAAGPTFYLACGLKTGDYPVIWGRPAILFGNDGAWTMGALLDTDPAFADYSVYSSCLFSFLGSLVFIWRGIDSAGLNYIVRWGYAPLGSHNTPAAWAWSTAYEFSDPSPAVAGVSSPYAPQIQAGASTGFAQTAEEIRMITTAAEAGGDFFITYLLKIVAGVIVNDFRVGRAYFTQ